MNSSLWSSETFCGSKFFGYNGSVPAPKPFFLKFPRQRKTFNFQNKFKGKRKKKWYINPTSFKFLKNYYTKHVSSWQMPDRVVLSKKNGYDYKRFDWSRKSWRKKEAVEMLKSDVYAFHSYDWLVKKGALSPKRLNRVTTMIDGAHLEEEFLRRELIMALQDDIYKRDTSPIKRKIPKKAIYVDLDGKTKLLGWWPENKHRGISKVYKQLAEHKYMFTDKNCPYFVTLKEVKVLFNMVVSFNVSIRDFDPVTWAKSASKKWKYLVRKARKNATSNT